MSLNEEQNLKTLISDLTELDNDAVIAIFGIIESFVIKLAGEYDRALAEPSDKMDKLSNVCNLMEKLFKRLGVTSLVVEFECPYCKGNMIEMDDGTYACINLKFHSDYMEKRK